MNQRRAQAAATRVQRAGDGANPKKQTADYTRESNTPVTGGSRRGGRQGARAPVHVEGDATHHRGHRNRSETRDHTASVHRPTPHHKPNHRCTGGSRPEVHGEGRRGGGWRRDRNGRRGGKAARRARVVGTAALSGARSCRHERRNVRAAAAAPETASPRPRPRGTGHPRGAPGRVARALSRRRLPSVDLCANLAEPERGGGIPYRLQWGYSSDTNQRPFEFFSNILRPILGVKHTVGLLRVSRVQRHFSFLVALLTVSYSTDIQPFSQKSRTPTVAKEFQIGLCGVVEADLELFCDSWSAGFLGDTTPRCRGKASVTEKQKPPDTPGLPTPDRPPPDATRAVPRAAAVAALPCRRPPHLLTPPPPVARPWPPSDAGGRHVVRCVGGGVGGDTPGRTVAGQ